jgi:hypothetical protein
MSSESLVSEPGSVELESGDEEADDDEDVEEREDNDVCKFIFNFVFIRL